jgi:16S rRNA (guanine527-N7)-methyltransferase
VFERGPEPPDVSGSIARQPWDVLIPDLLKAGVDVEAAMERLKRYTTLLLQWNRTASNLISRNDEARFVERHLLESVAAARWLKDSGASRWLDFGTGGGLPAIPLLLCGVGTHWTLVESRRTKTLFLRKVVQEMQLGNVSVENIRLEDADGSLGTFDAFTSRATLPLVPTLGLAARQVAAGGRAFLWKGSGREEEMAAGDWQKEWELDGLLGVGGNQTVVCRFLRHGENPA